MRFDRTLMLCPQNQPHGTDGQLTIQSTVVNQGYRTTGPKKRPSSCPYCPTGKDFGRFQELKRHVRDLHVPPSSCPFCDFTWTRPDKIKDHIISNHGDTFTAEFLIKFRAFSGRQVTEFLGADDYGPHVEAVLRSPSAS